MSDLDFAADRFLGMTEDEARREIEAAGWRFRVRNRDGKGLMGTADMNMNRINVQIDKGKVTRAWLG